MSNIDIQESLDAAHRQNAEGAVKTWEDLKRYETILTARPVDLIIECGTFSGGSAAWFSQFAPVLTIDIDDSHLNERHLARWGDRVKFILGSTTDEEIVQRVYDIAWQRNVFVVLDSDHGGPHVYNELLAYAPLVQAGGHLTVEDTLLRWMDDKTTYIGNPLDAIEAWSPNHPEWTLDLNIENMFTQSQHLGGWLKREE